MAAFNQPSHTIAPGDLDCWDSTDEGRTWNLRGTVAERSDENSNVVHGALGLNGRGELIAITGGIGDCEGKSGKRRMLQPTVSRSRDEGKTWDVLGPLDCGLKPTFALVPFGTVAVGMRGDLRASAYLSTREEITETNNAGTPFAAYIIRSKDDGRTWGDAVRIGAGINETALLHLGDGEWLAAARTDDRPKPELGEELRLFRSTDDGATWKDEGLVTGVHQHPAHLLRLADGRILLSYGNRRESSIDARLSDDAGRTWGEPRVIFKTQPGDQGYPSSAQLEDGRIATVFYAQSSSLRAGYHAGCVVWTLDPRE
jgi:hypothetical protein